METALHIGVGVVIFIGYVLFVIMIGYMIKQGQRRDP
jgi:hypothetical protein